MESGIPKNSINTPMSLDKFEAYEKYEKQRIENDRLRQNNVDLKLQIIELKKNLGKILKIIQDECITV